MNTEVGQPEISAIHSVFQSVVFCSCFTVPDNKRCLNKLTNCIATRNNNSARCFKLQHSVHLKVPQQQQCSSVLLQHP